MSRCLSVCLSVRPSVTRRYFVETAKHIIKVSPPSDSQTILVFCTKRDGNTPTGTGAPNARGYEESQFSTNISEMMPDRAVITMEG